MISVTAVSHCASLLPLPKRVEVAWRSRDIIPNTAEENHKLHAQRKRWGNGRDEVYVNRGINCGVVFSNFWQSNWGSATESVRSQLEER